MRSLIFYVLMFAACSNSTDEMRTPNGIPPWGPPPDDGGSAPDVTTSTNDASDSDSGTTSDAGTSEDSAPTEASKCPGSKLRTCDGFEGSAIDTTLWAMTFTSNATVTIDATRAMRGKTSLHVHTGVSGSDTAGTNGGVRTTHGFPFPNDDIWGRVFVYMQGQSPDMHTDVVEAVGNLGDGGVSHYRIGVTTNHVISGNYIPGDYADRSATSMPLDKWSCFEWHFDGTKSEYHFYVDGNELADMAITSAHTPAWTAPRFAYVEMGLHLYHDLTDVPTLDAWYDEFALDSARVGCAN